MNQVREKPSYFRVKWNKMGHVLCHHQSHHLMLYNCVNGVSSEHYRVPSYCGPLEFWIGTTNGLSQTCCLHTMMDAIVPYYQAIGPYVASLTLRAPHCAHSPATDRRIWAHIWPSQPLQGPTADAMSTWEPCNLVPKILPSSYEISLSAHASCHFS